MYRLRNARPQDRPGLFELAKILNTLNLPPDNAVLDALLERSSLAFSSSKDAPFCSERHWTFVLEDPSGQVVGTSGMHAQHGTPQAPHNFFKVQTQEHCSQVQGPTPQVLFHRHQLLQLARTYDGPTEVGGLVLSPACRGRPGKLGTLLSLGRFLLVACRRPLFRPNMLAEVLPPLGHNEEGEPTSPLWDALGAKFTGLSYNEADKLSLTHLDLIPSLFPDAKIYTALLPKDAQAVIGAIGEGSKGAAHLLRKIGFHQSNEIDPFDGGPHLHANTDDLAPLRYGRWARVKVAPPGPDASFALLAHDRDDGEFRALRAPVQLQGDEVCIASDAAQGLEAPQGAEVWVWDETQLGAVAQSR